MGMQIGEVAEKVGMAPSAIRYYEEIGLLGPVRREGGRRVFDGTIVQRLALIRLLVESGFSLEEARLLVSDRSPGRVESRELGRRKLVEMLCAAYRDAIGKLGQPPLAHQAHVLDFQIARLPSGTFQQKIDA